MSSHYSVEMLLGSLNRDQTVVVVGFPPANNSYVCVCLCMMMTRGCKVSPQDHSGGKFDNFIDKEF